MVRGSDTAGPSVSAVSARYARTRVGVAGPRQRVVGVTLLEVLLTVMILGVLAAVAIPLYSNYRAQADVQKAVNDIGAIQTAISVFAVDNQGLPATLADLGPAIAGMTDPWGTAYQYVNHADVKGKGKFRKDKNIVPINSDYDLWSNGPDGASVSPLTAKPSRDDIVRANNGRFIGIASDYDP